MQSQQYFQGKVVVITGGSSGIGYALAESIAGMHPRVVVLVSHEKEKLQAAALRIQKEKPQTEISFYVADIGDSQSVQVACADIVSKHGAPDIVINNAGYAHYHLFHEMTDEEIFQHANVNLIGAMRVVRSFLPSMRAAKRGQIVNVASIAGHMIITPNLVYGAAKHGMVAWSEGLAAELAADHITVQVISPGRVVTDFFRHESFQKRVAGKETRMTVSMEKVVDASINAIIKRKKVTIVPKYWAYVAWSLQAFPRLMKPLYHTILKRRIKRLQGVDSINS